MSLLYQHSQHEVDFDSFSRSVGEFQGSPKLLFWNYSQIRYKASGKIVIEKWEIQADPKFAGVKNEIKDSTFLSIDIHSLHDADDILVRSKHSSLCGLIKIWFKQIEAAVYSKVDGVYNPFVRPDPIHICKVHEHDDPLIQFMHEEVLKFGNVTKACPLKKGGYYYMHDFAIDESKFPIPLPEGEFRLDVNASVVTDGVETFAYSSELFFKTVKGWRRKQIIRT